MHTSHTVGAHIRELLEHLGTTPAEIAASLEDEGARGTPNASTDCVLARYLNAVLRGDPVIRSVAVTRTHVYARIRPRRRRRVVVALPSPLAEFVLGFDAQRYPALVGGEEPAVSAAAQPG
ncbi:MAG TPA: hypothetical protein VMB72_08005 [Acidimicrobiales bacterium]|nr:hypothetical protein [Acidimicrobiales bacterium]